MIRKVNREAVKVEVIKHSILVRRLMQTQGDLYRFTAVELENHRENWQHSANQGRDEEIYMEEKTSENQHPTSVYREQGHCPAN